MRNKELKYHIDIFNNNNALVNELIHDLDTEIENWFNHIDALPSDISSNKGGIIMSEDTRQWGKYQHTLDEAGLEILQNSSELEIYSIITKTSLLLHALKENKSDHDTDDTKYIEELSYFIEYVVYFTIKYGTNIPEPTNGDHVIKTPEYMTWYKWWDKYINQLSNDELKVIQTKLHIGAKVSEYRPNGDWRDEMC
jgi:hypothetical protein